MRAFTNARSGRLTIGQVSRVTGINIETIRYYERIDLRPPPPRTSGGRRSYCDADVRQLRFIRRARELGFSIAGIRALLALAASNRDQCDGLRDIAAAHLADVREKIADLKKLERILAESVGECDEECCKTPAPVCPVLEVLQA